MTTEPQSPFEYATPTAAWEPWYEEYRYGALYLFPPAPLRSRINALRQRHDPRSQAICDAHISLTVPLPRPLHRDGVEELAATVARHASLAIRWGPPYQYPGVPGVVLRIEPVEPLTALVRALEGCRCFHGAAARRYPFSPHLTIAEFLTLEASETLVRDLEGAGLAGEFWCTEIGYAIPDPNFHFTERMAWPLGSRHRAA